MYEQAPTLDKKAKRLRADVKETFGIDTKDPLSPEYLRERYNSALESSEEMSRIADLTKETAATYDNPEAKAHLEKRADTYRAEGRIVLHQTLKDIEKYARDNSGYYSEQARADMTADLAKRAETEGFASTLDDIKNLPGAGDNSREA